MIEDQLVRGRLYLGTTALILVTLWGAACSSITPTRSHHASSLSALMVEQRLAIAKACNRTPERFGFPYTREEYMRWRRDVGRWMPDLHQHCFAVARKLVN